ncbi:nucleotidyltransferase family protein [Achromobacter denitrificans]|uniref:Nucleotidyltransferase family protein n=2 Tax=Alcaligenaceae TaxID=506 RepID=A0A6N0JWA8_ACHDE|nr:nucleotidyltransferase family protein [Achromobacter denitrificans]QKQ51294.1 nucleotidyltransferase family protein [Achromobacter denitrificans]WFC70474.1 nucleotidyltransferase family protein [Achromobacter denitrificans]
MRWLRAARDHGPAGGCIAAGAVRSLVWNHLHGYPAGSHPPADLDFVYHDPTDLSAGHEDGVARRLRAAAPDAPWEVVNQARVHLWRRDGRGAPPPPAASLAAGIAAWPETATCVGVALEGDDELRIVAPHGLADLFALVLRPSPGADPRAYAQRLADKRHADTWPRLTIIPPALSRPPCRP